MAFNGAQLCAFVLSRFARAAEIRDFLAYRSVLAYASELGEPAIPVLINDA